LYRHRSQKSLILYERSCIMKGRVLSIVFGAAISCCLLCACSSVDPSNRFNGQQLTLPSLATVTPIAHVNASVWGFYFFKWPIMSGSTLKPGEVVFFEDTATRIGPITDMITYESGKLGANTLVDLQSKKDSIWIAPLFVFFVRQIEMSGNALLVKYPATPASAPRFGAAVPQK